MNCEAVGHLMDDYLDNELSQRELDLFEEHLGRCYRCVRELRRRPAFERGLRRALASSVQPLSLPSEVSSRIIRASELSLRRALWSDRAGHVFQAVTGMAALCLVLVGILFLTQSIPVSSRLQPIALFPVRQASLSNLDPAPRPAGNQPALPDADLPPVPSSRVSMIFEPWTMHPRDVFTITVYLWSADPQPVKAVSLDLDVNGPTGYYRFDLALQDPLPAGGVSVLKVTPELLAEPCHEQYLISPTDLFSATGVYDVRVTMSKPVVAGRRP